MALLLFGCGDCARNQCGESDHGDDVVIPQRISLEGQRITQISCGERHTLLLAQSGKIFAFGDNLVGQLGLGSREPRSKPCYIPIPGCEEGELDAESPFRVVSVGAGGFHSVCATLGGALYTWGEAMYGKCGNKTGSLEPQLLPYPSNVRGVAAGAQHTVCVDAQGKMYSFGNGYQGRLGLGHEDHTWTPTQITMDVPARAVACGEAHSACISVHGALYTWGCGGDGRLGHGDLQTKWEPAQVQHPDAIDGIMISCGSRHTALLNPRGLYTWGRADNGRLGYAAKSESRAPQRVPIPPIAGDVCSVSCGHSHTAVATTTGRLYTFGRNERHQLGHGHDGDCLEPTVVLPLDGHVVSMVACGYDFSMFLFVR